MLGKLLPALLAVAGLGAGVGGGYALRPAPADQRVSLDNPCGEAAPAPVPHRESGGPESSNDYVKLNNQFVIPVVEEDQVTSLVVLSLSLEIAPGLSEQVYAREPKLRDALLQVLFDHANIGGFKGSFTRSTRMTSLRQALLEVAEKTLGPIVSDVLIVDIVRQDT